MTVKYFEKKAQSIGYKRPTIKKKVIDYFYFFVYLLYPLLKILDIIFYKKNIFLIVRADSGIGDALVMTNFVSFLYKKYNLPKIVIYSRYKDVFLNNPKIKKIIYSNRIKNYFFKFLFFNSDLLSLNNIIYVYSNKNANELFTYQSKKHLLEILIKNKNFCFDLKKYPKKCEVYLTNDEIKYFSKKYCYLPKDYHLILSEVVNDMHTKNWGFQNMQGVVNGLQNINWIQVGTYKEKKLSNVLYDLRGKTSFREIFYLMKNCSGVLCTEGLYTHLSSAFNKRCYTIFSGYHPVNISKYSNVIPIVSDKKIPCANCWLLKCPFYENPICLKNITVHKVINTIKYYN